MCCFSWDWTGEMGTLPGGLFDRSLERNLGKPEAFTPSDRDISRSESSKNM